MYIIVAGMGRVGSTLAKSLSEKNYDLVVIDSRKEVCDEVAGELDALVLNGDCTKVKTLENAGIEEADVFIAVTGNQELNLISGLIAKKHGVAKTIARVSEPSYKEVFESLGIDVIISPELVAAKYLEKLIDRPGVVDLAIIGRGDAEILELIIPPNSEVSDKQIKELGAKDYVIIAIYEGSELKIPDGNTELKPYDRILLLAKSESLDTVRKTFSSGEL
ncbi:potassium channel family protein [Methanococcus voltae]|uniref:Trk system potassium uptake protein TrkA n=2 Tax=Methanococcus voltae TaxID=2188 RepID=A0A8J7RCP3_METVO|nr:TrkA family potassium uptake protein [Methanococcus voltae]MBP2172237.1 trk system potassium uptake protein TrkA [Methanococcus voltae]MBP2200807.1 trk system potassium uptake protein TrkA [Methanococcus voltae]MCS3921531.1 trk system potassium uptake protein TrkA [Methanococcus voltae PS]